MSNASTSQKIEKGNFRYRGVDMNRRKVWNLIVVRLALVLLGALLIANCTPRLKVGELQSESQSVEVGDAESVRAEIEFGAGNLDMTGGAEKLLEADFTYNVAELKPEVEYSDGKLIVQQPENRGWPALSGITGFRNEWNLRLSNEVPIDLKVNMGAGTGDLQLASLSLTGLDISLGAGDFTIDLNGDWKRDLHVTIDAGATDITVRLPREVGVRIEISSGPHTVDATGLTKDGEVYTNLAYAVSDVTLQLDIEAGIGMINMEVEE
jgi:hypothetical protein